MKGYSLDLRQADKHMGPWIRQKVVRITITETCPADIACPVRQGLKEVKGLTRLDWDLVDKGKSIVQCYLLSVCADYFNYIMYILRNTYRLDPGPAHSTDVAHGPIIPPAVTKGKLTEAIDVMKYALEKSNCRFYKGRVYEFEEKSRSAYTSA